MMSEEMKKEITEFVKIVEQLNPTSFMLMQNNAQVLLARDTLEKEAKKLELVDVE